MQVVVFGGTGMVGSALSAELTKRGHSVTSVTRSGGEVAGTTSVAGEIGDATLVQRLAADADAIVSATGPSRTGGSHAEWLQSMASAAGAVGETRFLVVGGAGSLLVDGKRLVDDPAFPELYKSEAETQAEELSALQASPETLDWTVISPAPELFPGEPSGDITIGGDSPAGDRISTGDFAIAIADELEEPQHRRTRFTAASSGNLTAGQ